MKSEVSKKLAAAALLLALALVSFFPIAQKMSQPQTFSHAIESLDKKQETVLELTAASTAASAAITLLPGDAATPIAEKLADLSGYFLIVLCAIFLENSSSHADCLTFTDLGEDFLFGSCLDHGL